MSKPKASRWVPITLDNHWFVEFLTEPAGFLRLGPALLKASFRLSIKHRHASEADDLLACSLRLADAEGRLWEAESILTPRVLMEKVVDLRRREPARWLEHAPPRWHAALRQPLIKGLHDQFDDRFYRYFYLDNTAFSLQFKYLYSEYDLAHREGTQLLVRVSGWFGNWNRLPAEEVDGRPLLPLPPVKRSPPKEEDEDDQEEDEEEEWLENLAPLVYPLDCRELLFRNTAYLQPNGVSRETDVPAPLLFRRLKTRGEPQSSVTFRPAESKGPFVATRPAPVSGADPEEWNAGEPTRLKAGWWEIGFNDYGEPGEMIFSARPEGTLHIAAQPLRLSFRLAVEPLAEREPFDVLRCVIRLADSTGRLWEATNLFTPEVFLEQLVNLRRLEAAHPFASAEKEEKESLRKRPVLSGIRDFLDDGGYRHFLAKTSLFSVQLRGQTPVYDVALADDRFLVRVSGLTGMARPVEYEEDFVSFAQSPEGRKGGKGKAGDDDLLPPLVYEIPFHRLLFRNTSFAVDEGHWHHNDIPIPVVFQQIDGKREPQPAVTFLPVAGGVDGQRIGNRRTK
jgi:hypothetical protein